MAWLVVTALVASKGQSLLGCVQSGIVDHPLGAFSGFRDRGLLGRENNRPVSRSPRLALILAVDPVQRPPHFIRRLIDLARCGGYREAFVIVIHTLSLARYGMPHRDGGLSRVDPAEMNSMRRIQNPDPSKTTESRPPGNSRSKSSPPVDMSAITYRRDLDHRLTQRLGVFGRGAIPWRENIVM